MVLYCILNLNKKPITEEGIYYWALAHCNYIYLIILNVETIMSNFIGVYWW